MIKSFDHEVLETSKSKFVIVTENDDIDTIKSKLLSKKGPFKEITNVAIVLKRSADDFSIFARNHDKNLAPFVYKESPEDLEFTAGYEVRIFS